MHVHDSIDRVSPTVEPDQQEVMYQNWHHLLFLHWEVPPAELQALIPAGLTVDLFEGKAYAGLIPFTLSGVRPILLPPLPGVSSFHEVNVRTYVHRDGRDPGVWFFSLDASSLYSQDEEHRLHRARVHHQPYPLQKVELLELDETLIWSSGIRRPESVPMRHYAREVNVKVYGPERV